MKKTLYVVLEEYGCGSGCCATGTSVLGIFGSEKDAKKKYKEYWYDIQEVDVDAEELIAALQEE